MSNKDTVTVPEEKKHVGPVTSIRPVTPPAVQDGEVVAWLLNNPGFADNGEPSKTRQYQGDVPLYTRPASRAVVDEAMVERACFARWPSWRNPKLRNDVGREDMRAFLTTALHPKDKNG